MFNNIVFTCEHGGNQIPGKYKYLFNGAEEILQTHRGWDIGALEAAKFLSKQLNAPLFYTETCRLLVEANRSIGFEDHFSEFTTGLSQVEKQHIIEEYYLPYRSQVEAFFSKLIYSGNKVLHVSVHSCTPVLHEHVRNMDLSFLFDPDRDSEKEICEDFRSEIQKADHNLLVRFNYPYLGTDDGFTTHLRTLFNDDQYAGIEIEINQKYPLGNVTEWKYLQNVLLEALKHVLQHKLQLMS